jgi:hypothetical protein
MLNNTQIFKTVSPTYMQTLSKMWWPTLSRLTRWDEFSPIGQMFILGSFLKLTEVCSSNLWATFCCCKTLFINFDKKRVGPHFGRFFCKLVWTP